MALQATLFGDLSLVYLDIACFQAVVTDWLEGSGSLEQATLPNWPPGGPVTSEESGATVANQTDQAGVCYRSWSGT